jgi:hypothetical protein
VTPATALIFAILGVALIIGVLAGIVIAVIVLTWRAEQ